MPSLKPISAPVIPCAAICRHCRSRALNGLPSNCGAMPFSITPFTNNSWKYWPRIIMLPRLAAICARRASSMTGTGELSETSVRAGTPA
jgi:hypothetical protein